MRRVAELLLEGMKRAGGMRQLVMVWLRCGDGVLHELQSLRGADQ